MNQCLAVVYDNHMGETTGVFKSISSDQNGNKGSKILCDSKQLKTGIKGVFSSDFLINFLVRDCSAKLLSKNNILDRIQEKIPKVFDSKWDIDGIVVRPFLWYPKTFFRVPKSSILISFYLTPVYEKIIMIMHQIKDSEKVNRTCTEIDLMKSKWKKPKLRIDYDCFGNIAKYKSNYFTGNLIVAVLKDRKWLKYTYLVFVPPDMSASMLKDPEKFKPTRLLSDQKMESFVAFIEIQVDQKYGVVFGWFGSVKNGTYCISVKVLNNCSEECRTYIPKFEVSGSDGNHSIERIWVYVCGIVVTLVLLGICFIAYKKCLPPHLPRLTSFKIFAIQEDGMENDYIRKLKERLKETYEGINVIIRADHKQIDEPEFYEWLKELNIDYFILLSKEYMNEENSGKDTSERKAVGKTVTYINRRNRTLNDENVYLFYFKTYKETKHRVCGAETKLLKAKDDRKYSKEEMKELVAEIEVSLRKIFKRKGLKKRKSNCKKQILLQLRSTIFYETPYHCMRSFSCKTAIKSEPGVEVDQNCSYTYPASDFLTVEIKTIKAENEDSPSSSFDYYDRKPIEIELNDRDKGCSMGSYFVGCLAYADDLTLIAPSKKALQILIDICEEYASEFDVLFNGSKSQFMIFRGRECKVDNCSIFVNKEALSNVRSAMHLGHKISTDNKDCTISFAVSQFWKSFNIFRADFGKIYSDLQCKLFKQYCCSFYGAPLWHLSFYKKICVPWRKALRMIWNVSPMTHCKVMALLSDSIPLDLSLKKRFCAFVSGIEKYGSCLIKHVAKISRQNPFSVFSYNYNEITNIYGDKINNSTRAMINRKWKDSIPGAILSEVNVLKEMIEVRAGKKICDCMAMDDVVYIISDICSAPNQDALQQQAAMQPPMTDQITLLQNEDESFVLAPLEQTVTHGPERTVKAKRRRKLIVDEVINVSAEEIKSQLSDTTDIVTMWDLAPRPKLLTPWKESGGVEKLFALPGHNIGSKHLSKFFHSHLTTNCVENQRMVLNEDAENDEEQPALKVNEEQELLGESENQRNYSMQDQVTPDVTGQFDSTLKQHIEEDISGMPPAQRSRLGLDDGGITQIPSVNDEPHAPSFIQPPQQQFLDSQQHFMPPPLHNSSQIFPQQPSMQSSVFQPDILNPPLQPSNTSPPPQPLPVFNIFQSQQQPQPPLIGNEIEPKCAHVDSAPDCQCLQTETIKVDNEDSSSSVSTYNDGRPQGIEQRHMDEGSLSCKTAIKTEPGVEVDQNCTYTIPASDFITVEMKTIKEENEISPNCTFDYLDRTTEEIERSDRDKEMDLVNWSRTAIKEEPGNEIKQSYTNVDPALDCHSLKMKNQGGHEDSPSSACIHNDGKPQITEHKDIDEGSFSSKMSIKKEPGFEVAQNFPSAYPASDFLELKIKTVKEENEVNKVSSSNTFDYYDRKPQEIEHNNPDEDLNQETCENIVDLTFCKDYDEIVGDTGCKFL
ncbi:Double-strand-break repair protein rad21 [Nymphon striatum]|nr:Double-strand-break repair protein rad21 [Nymphon striatum]